MHLVKPLLTLTAAALLAGAAQAQKIRVSDGSLDVLKDQKEINLEFTYDNMKVGKFDSEADYIKSRKADLDKKEPGRGDTWEKSWIADRKSRYEPKFDDLFTQVTDMKVAPGAKYTLIFHTNFTEPGFNVGVMKKSAYIDADFTVVETADRNKVVAKGTIDKAPGRTFWGSDFDTGERIGEAYEMAGKALGKKIK
ncbi:hypothetical protein ACWKWU_00800 [Chitinophaga lutea]